jgi:23S rRNA pseudouridine1911/1915/1917 synthase
MRLCETFEHEAAAGEAAGRPSETQIIGSSLVPPDGNTPGVPFDDEDASPLQVCVPLAWQGMRLDRALALWQVESSRTHLQSLIDDGGLLLDGQVCRQASRKLRLGQQLSLTWKPPEAMLAFVPEPMDLPIVHEDESLLVVNKPAGLVVHPAAGNWHGTLMNGLLAHHSQAVGLPRAGIVHRLDKDTSGLMVVAKNVTAYTSLVAQLADRSVKREYLAICHGRWLQPRRIDAPVGRDPRQRTRMAVVSTAMGGKSAQTDFTPLSQGHNASLLVCKLHTGRTHQIRVHSAYAGHPLVGDVLYGGKLQTHLLRQGLHATRLTLMHPGSGHEVCWEVEPPEDFKLAGQDLLVT